MFILYSLFKICFICLNNVYNKQNVTKNLFVLMFNTLLGYKVSDVKLAGVSKNIVNVFKIFNAANIIKYLYDDNVYDY